MRKGDRAEGSKEHPLVSLPSDARTRRILDNAASTADFAFRHRITKNQFATLYSFVRNDAGLTVAPDLARPSANDRELISRPLIPTRVHPVILA